MTQGKVAVKLCELLVYCAHLRQNRNVCKLKKSLVADGFDTLEAKGIVYNLAFGLNDVVQLLISKKKIHFIRNPMEIIRGFFGTVIHFRMIPSTHLA